MSDRYAQLVNSRPGSLIARQVGLPRPVRLERHSPGDPLIRGRVLLGAAPRDRLLEPVTAVLAQARCELATHPDQRMRELVARAGLDATIFNPAGPRRAAPEGAGVRRHRHRQTRASWRPCTPSSTVPSHSSIAAGA